MLMILSYGNEKVQMGGKGVEDNWDCQWVCLKPLEY